MDLILRNAGANWSGWRRVALALALGASFVAVFFVCQWFFSEFLLTPRADNWFFAGNRYWGYASSPSRFATKFWFVTPNAPNFNPFNGRAAMISWALASGGAWIGLIWGGWMRKVQR
jgi:hypothetical protein